MNVTPNAYLLHTSFLMCSQLLNNGAVLLDHNLIKKVKSEKETEFRIK